MTDVESIVFAPVGNTDDPDQREKAVRIAVLIDESGSMLGAAADTITQLNSYLDEQATSDKPVIVSVYTFNSNGVQARFSGVDAKSAPRLSLATNDVAENLVYRPCGGTPLYDAIGTVISTEGQNEPTLAVILTDGQENESKEYRTLKSIQALIETQEKQGWVFTFLMAGLSRHESVAYTTQMMRRDYSGATMSYSKGMETEAFRGLAASTKKWEMGARSESYDALHSATNFYDEGTRDIRDKSKK